MKKLLINFLVFSIISFTGCSKHKLFTHITYEGTVYDTIGGHPVAGQTVSLDACNPYDGRNECATFLIGKSVTDSEGHFKIHEKAARSGRYFISAPGIVYKEITSSAFSEPEYTMLYMK